MKYLLLSLLVIFSSLYWSKGTEIFVSPTANATDSTCGEFSNPCNNLTFALRLASNGDTISLFPGDYIASEGNANVVITGNFAIRSLYGSQNTSIDLEGNSRAFLIQTGSQVNISGITFYKGFADVGTAIAFSGSYLGIDDCVFLNNSQNVVNQDPTGVGAIGIYGGIALITNSVFIKNSADVKVGQGGAIFAQGATITISNCELERSSASTGGAIWSDNSLITIDTCTFFGNSANYDGADIVAVEESNVYVNNTHFMNSNCGENGAVLSASFSVVSFENSYFMSTTAGSFGGSIYLTDNSIVSCRGCSFQDSQVQNYFGGGVNVNNGEFIAKDTVMSGCLANNYGGAIYAATSSSYVELDNVQLNGNAAYYGGAIFVEYLAVLNVTNLSMSGNKAGGGVGDSIYCSDSTIYVSKSNISESDIYCSDQPTATFCTIYGDGNWSSMCGETAGTSGGLPATAGSITSGPMTSGDISLTTGSISGTSGAPKITSGSFTTLLGTTAAVVVSSGAESSERPHHGLPVGGVVGIIVVVIAVIVVALVLGIMWVKRKEKLDPKNVWKKIEVTKSEDGEEELLQDYDDN